MKVLFAMQLHRSSVVACLLLCAGTGFGHDLKHEMSSAAFLINQKEAGTALDDVKMAHLTDSIQGLFDAEPALSPVNAKTAKKVAAPTAVEKPKRLPAAKVGTKAVAPKTR